jgi:hypothetical protein
MKLVDRLSPCLDGGPTRDAQGTYRFHLTFPRFRLSAGGSSLDGPAGRLGVDRIGFPTAMTRPAIRSVHLDYGESAPAQPARQAGAVAPGPLNPDPLDRAVRACPGQKRRIAGRSRVDLAGAEELSSMVEHSGDVLIGVGVDPYRDACRH